MNKKSNAMRQVDALIGKAGGKKKQKGGGARKIGRYNKHPSSQRYRAESRWEANRLRRIRRHLKKCPADRQARSALDSLGGPSDRAFLAGLPQ